MDFTLPGNMNIFKRMGFDVAMLNRFFGATCRIDIENGGSLRLGLFGAHFGVDFLDEAQGMVYPGFGEFELLYAGFKFKFDATWVNPGLKLLNSAQEGATAVASTAAQLLSLTMNPLLIFRDVIEWVDQKLARAEITLMNFKARMPYLGVLAGGNGSFGIVVRSAITAFVS